MRERERAENEGREEFCVGGGHRDVEGSLHLLQRVKPFNFCFYLCPSNFILFSIDPTYFTSMSFVTV